MIDMPKEAWAAIGAAIGVIGTVVAGLLRVRREDSEIASEIRDELRKDNADLRARIELLEMDRKKLKQEKSDLWRKIYEMEERERQMTEDMRILQLQVRDITEPNGR